MARVRPNSVRLGFPRIAAGESYIGFVCPDLRGWIGHGCYMGPASQAGSKGGEAAGQPPREHEDDPNQEHPHERLPADDPQGGQLVQRNVDDSTQHRAEKIAATAQYGRQNQLGRKQPMELLGGDLAGELAV